MSVDTRKYSMMQLRQMLGGLYDTDPLGYRRLVECVLVELGQGRAELARQDDVLQSLTFDLLEAQKEAVRLTNFVHEEVLRREITYQGGSAAEAPPPPFPRIPPSSPLPFDPYSFQEKIVSLLPTPQLLYKHLADLNSAQEWGDVITAFEATHRDTSLTTIVLNACPEAKELLRSRGVII
eukprot:TRINITY_DN15096_c0_g1_i1.p1 TRINITY_DN15096_c0_g1~~TRINITY_DN15096_c0_g1_i1.p1  ORF type:complete len:180 (+),score=39.06 TRINITY_DN15096_c0_g1_i1:55-594(+)